MNGQLQIERELEGPRDSGDAAQSARVVVLDE
jgi:hypothetical protein